MNNAIKISEFNTTELWQNSAVRAVVISLGVIAMSLPMFYDTITSMIHGWNSSETYTHCYLVIPTALFLMWRERKAALPALSPSWILALLLLPAGFLWLLGRAADVLLVEHVALIAIIVASIVALIGLPLAKKLWFPLCFMFLAVPFGEELLPVMMDFTADFTVAGLQLMGFPVFREGHNFSLPTGNWSVVEACSGVRYLIASFTIGALYAYLTYSSLVKRSVFLVIAVIVPIIGNGLRAIIIVLIGHYSSMTLATGVDHLIYGWLFFGLLMFLLFWLGGYFADAPENLPEQGEGTKATANKLGKSKQMMAALMAVIGGALVWPVWGQLLKSEGNINLAPPTTINLDSRYTNCADCKSLVTQDFVSPTYQIEAKATDAGGNLFQVAIVSYDSRALEGELVNSQNKVVDRSQGQAIIKESAIAHMHNRLQAKTVTGKSGPIRVWHYNLFNNDWVSNRVMFKGREAITRIFGQDYTASTVIISTPITDSEAATDQLLAKFLTENEPATHAYINRLIQ
ncbi:MAG: exosortase A [Hahellaceae bacterium]|nr:exosortase A [Hahellaceae bacterium]